MACPLLCFLLSLPAPLQGLAACMACQPHMAEPLGTAHPRLNPSCCCRDTTDAEPLHTHPSRRVRPRPPQGFLQFSSSRCQTAASFQLLQNHPMAGVPGLSQETRSSTHDQDPTNSNQSNLQNHPGVFRLTR